MFRSSSMELVLDHASTAELKPYQPGSIRRHWLQLNTQGMARRSSIACEALRDEGRLPMLSSAISAIGVEARKYSTKPSALTSARYALNARADRSSTIAACRLR